jgi:hypothetical protein
MVFWISLGLAGLLSAGCAFCFATRRYDMAIWLALSVSVALAVLAATAFMAQGTP